MGTVTPSSEDMPSEKVGFRDIYRAVGESESRIKEHISLVLLPLTTQMADHETRLRNIEENGSAEAREAMQKAAILATEHRALVSRVDAHDDRFNSQDAQGAERRRIGGVTNKVVVVTILVSNFIIGLVIMLANLLTKPVTV
jgi:hypothetical protein